MRWQWSGMFYYEFLYSSLVVKKVQTLFRSAKIWYNYRWLCCVLWTPYRSVVRKDRQQVGYNQWHCIRTTALQWTTIYTVTTRVPQTARLEAPHTLDPQQRLPCMNKFVCNFYSEKYVSPNEWRKRRFFLKTKINRGFALGYNYYCYYQCVIYTTQRLPPPMSGGFVLPTPQTGAGASVRGGTFVRGLLSEGLCPGGLCPFPPITQYHLRI